MSSESQNKPVKPGFGIFLAGGAAAAGSALAAIIAPICVAIALGISETLKGNLAGWGAALVVLFFPGVFIGFFTFVCSLVPNWIGMSVIISRELRSVRNPISLQGREFSAAGAAYGMAVLALSLLIMEVKWGEKSGGSYDLSFIGLLPAAMISGVLTFRIAKAMIKSARSENFTVQINDK
jgi:hypothetical protein